MPLYISPYMSPCTPDISTPPTVLPSLTCLRASPTFPAHEAGRIPLLIALYSFTPIRVLRAI
eukprot:1362133-Rhodomonas_salina.3